MESLADRRSAAAIASIYSRERHSNRRDGPVMKSTGNTINGVVKSARKNVPQKPIRRWVPQNAVNRQATM
jgi:hypothetical protein